MKNDRYNTIPLVVSGAPELVRGRDQAFLNQLKPLVRRNSVRLDLAPVERIDAAGLTALIQIFCAAHDAGHDFTVFNPQPHVAEILSLVGLDRILLSPMNAFCTDSGVELAESAA